MGRYVVIQFDDNKDGEHFAQDEFYHYGGTVLGMYAQPTQFCRGSCGVKGRVRPWVRGSKFGWWVCGNCHKPAKISGDVSLMKHVICQGVNLLEGGVQAVSSVWTPGWGVYGREKGLEVPSEGNAADQTVPANGG